jgi:hypothetical protein
VERVLIVGEAGFREQLAQSLASNPAARLEVVGFLPLADERQLISDWGASSRRRREVSFDDLGPMVHELNVDPSSMRTVWSRGAIASDSISPRA